MTSITRLSFIALWFSLIANQLTAGDANTYQNIQELLRASAADMTALAEEIEWRFEASRSPSLDASHGEQEITDNLFATAYLETRKKSLAVYNGKTLRFLDNQNLKAIIRNAFLVTPDISQQVSEVMDQARQKIEICQKKLSEHKLSLESPQELEKCIADAPSNKMAYLAIVFAFINDLRPHFEEEKNLALKRLDSLINSNQLE